MGSLVSERPNQGSAMLTQARSRHQSREVGYAAVMLKEGWSVAWRREKLVVVPPVLSRAARQKRQGEKALPLFE